MTLEFGVCYLAKIRILKQITTISVFINSNVWCLLSCKDTNFKANHNTLMSTFLPPSGVCYLAKIRILKQITTRKLYLSLRLGCLLSCKDTNFKANHNSAIDVKTSCHGVCYLAKIRILKQITTLPSMWKQVVMVFVILQRYEF